MKRIAFTTLFLAGTAVAQTFQETTEAAGTGNQGLYGTGLAWGDYDGDGDPDLYVTNWATALTVAANALYRNDGDGTFTDVAADLGVDNKNNSTAAAWADFDNDGDLDLYVANFSEQDFLYENRDGEFRIGAARASINRESRGSEVSIDWGDYNLDGNLDIYLGKYYFDNELYRNVGDGTFEAVSVGLGDKRDSHHVDWVDYDGDGDLDVYVTNREQENGLFRNDLTTNGTFTAVACAASIGNREIGQSGAWADYDNDGDMDLYLGNIGANALFRNDGGDQFVDVAEQANVRSIDTGGWITASVAWVDYDGDGNQDIYLANGGDRQPQQDVLFAGNGDGTFRDATVESGLPTGRSYHVAVGWADYDGNGSPDVYAISGMPDDPKFLGTHLFQNNTSADQFLRIRVRGLGPAAGGGNVDGIGARVRLLDSTTDQLRAYRQVSAGQNNTELIFGAPAGPYTVEVLFPGRQLPVIQTNLSAGDSLTVVEQ